MNQRWRQIVLWLMPIGIAVFLGFQFLGGGLVTCPWITHQHPPQCGYGTHELRALS